MAKPVKSILQIWTGASWETVYASEARATTTTTAINNGSGYLAAATSLTVDSTTGILAGDYIKIANELIQVKTVASSTVLNPVARGQLTGTTATVTVAAADMSDNAVVTKVDLAVSALFKINIEEKYGNPVVCTIELFNKPYAAGITKGYVEDRYGAYLDTYQRIRVLDDYSKAILFYGRVYRKDIEFNRSTGSIIRITAFDALKELADNRIEGDKGNFSSQTKRSGVIEKIVEKFTYQNTADKNINLSTADAQKFSDSVADIVSTEEHDYSKGRVTGLSAIAKLAKLDPHSTEEINADNGYTYFVDNGFTSSLKTTSYTSAVPTLNYFKRGTMPDTSIGTDDFYKLTLSSVESDGDSSNSYTTTSNTLGTFQISKQYTDVSTAIALTYKDSTGAMATKTCYRAKVSNLAGGGTGSIFDKALLDDSISIELSPEIWIDTDTSSYTPEKVGQLIYLSDETGNDKFAVFTLDDGKVPEDIKSSTLVPGTAADKTTEYIRVDTFGSSAGASPVGDGADRFTVEETDDVEVELLRTIPFTFDDQKDPKETRIAIHSRFEASQTTTRPSRAEVSILDYPFTRLTVDPSSRSGNELTLPVDIYKYGARKGMVVRQLKSGVETGNYGYISEIATGGSPTVTVVLSNAAGTQITGTNLPWADTDTFVVYIPIRPGFKTYLTNPAAGLTADGMLTNIDYSEGQGIQTSTLSLLTDNFAALTESSPGVSVGGTNSTPVSPDSGKRVYYNVTAGATTPLLSLPDSGDAYRRVDWAEGTLTVGTKTYAIAASNTYVALSNGWLPNNEWYVIYFLKSESTTAFKVASLANLPKDVDLIRIAQVKANTNTSLGALRRFESSDVILSAEAGATIDAADIADGAIDSAKFVRGAQPFTLTHTLSPTTNVWSSSSYNSVAWAASTLKYSDGDTLTVNADSATGLGANTTYWAYVDTTNGNITPTATAADAISDTKLLVALIRIGPDTEPAASIAPLGSQAPVLSTSGLAANAIVSDKIAANALDAHTITLSTGGKFVTASGLGRDSTNQWTTMSGAGTGGGLLIDTTGIIGTSKSDDGDINDTEFYITASDGKMYAGGGSIILDKTGLTINDTSGTFANSRFQVQSSGTDVFGIYEAGNSVYLTTDTRTGTIAYDMTVGPQGINDTGSILPRSADKVTLGSDALPFLDLYSTTVRVGASHYPLTTSGTNLLYNTAKVFYDEDTTNGGTLKLGTAVTDTNIIDAGYGLIRYEKDGNGDAADTLGFISGQTFGGRTGLTDGAKTPTTTNHGSAFYSMLSEIDTSARVGDGSGYVISRLIFEPIVDRAYYNNDSEVDTTDGYYNYAYLGYHNWLYSLNCYYINAGTGSAAVPTVTVGDQDTGMYGGGTNILGFSSNGTARWSIDASGDLLPAIDGSGVAGYDVGSASYQVASVRAYTLFFTNTASTSGTDLIVTVGGQIAKKTSSIQYKDNVKELVYDSSKLDKLRPVSYDYKLDNAPDIGLIAEEVDEVYPELINYDKEGKAESVKYHGLSVMLLDEVTKLRKEIKELKEKT